MDEQLRRTLRSENRSRSICELMRSGKLLRERVEWAAFLGDKDSIQCVGSDFRRFNDSRAQKVMAILRKSKLLSSEELELFRKNCINRVIGYLSLIETDFDLYLRVLDFLKEWVEYPHVTDYDLFQLFQDYANQVFYDEFFDMEDQAYFILEAFNTAIKLIQEPDLAEVYASLIANYIDYLKLEKNTKDNEINYQVNDLIEILLTPLRNNPYRLNRHKDIPISEFPTRKAAWRAAKDWTDLPHLSENFRSRIKGDSPLLDRPYRISIPKEDLRDLQSGQYTDQKIPDKTLRNKLQKYSSSLRRKLFDTTSLGYYCSFHKDRFPNQKYGIHYCMDHPGGHPHEIGPDYPEWHKYGHIHCEKPGDPHHSGYLTDEEDRSEIKEHVFLYPNLVDLKRLNFLPKRRYRSKRYKK